MKTHLFIGLFALAAVLSARAGIYSSTDTPLAIPDANPGGVSSQINVSGADSVLSTVTVTINVSGGYNGDLYAYLSYNGNLVTLLNRVGTGEGDFIQQTYGFSTSGFNNITLADSSASNIHDVANPVSGTTYNPDGATALDSTGSGAGFGGMNPNGTWTIFFADLSGGNTSTLEGWSLDITAVPEPVNVALAIFGGLLSVWSVARARVHHRTAAHLT